MMELTSLLRHTLLVSSIGVLAACSSADSTSTTPNTPAAPTAVTLSGSVFASDVSGATVTIKKTDSTIVAGPVTTNADGSYSIDLLDTELASDLVIESTGGSFIDETTGTGTTAGTMSAYVAGGTLADGDSAHVTPGTTITATLITQHGIPANDAQTTYFNAFAYYPDFSIEPVDPTDPATLNADDDSKHIGWRAAVFSKLTNDLGLTADKQFDLFAGIAEDLSDGKLDDVDIYVNMGAADITDPGDILDKYIEAAGSFTTAEAANLKISYTPPGENVHGKNTFTLMVTDTGGTPQTGLTDLQVMPMMYMADRNHATPMGGITELGGGEYAVTAYYLMPSRMMDGTTMGTWDLKVMTGMKSVHFYPNIDMAKMSNTVRVQLKGVDDKIINMDGLPVPRPYNLFRDNLVQKGSGTNYIFDVFIAPMENMMSFPALVDGMTLTSGMGGSPYDVTGITVEASADDGNNWITAAPGTTDGVWSFDALTLDNTSGASNDIRIRLTVSSEIKTTDGLTVQTDVNDFNTFTVTFP